MVVCAVCKLCILFFQTKTLLKIVNLRLMNKKHNLDKMFAVFFRLKHVATNITFYKFAKRKFEVSVVIHPYSLLLF